MKEVGIVIVDDFHRSLKEEEVWVREYRSIEQARSSMERWIEEHNHNRPHQALQNRTPHEAFLAWEALQLSVAPSVQIRGEQYRARRIAVTTLPARRRGELVLLPVQPVAESVASLFVLFLGFYRFGGAGHTHLVTHEGEFDRALLTRTTIARELLDVKHFV
jgi:putative transposase